MSTHQHFWKPRDVPMGRTCLWRLGALRLWIQRRESGWRIASEEGTSYEQMNASVVPNDVVPTSLAWQSIAWSAAQSAFSLRPEMPDRPVVAKPEERVVVPAGEAVTYFCLLPSWVRFMLGGLESGPNLEFDAWPTRSLSDTWFGSQTSGVLGYALAFPAGPHWEQLPISPHHVVVPVRIENESVEHLVFERLCLRTQYLGVFASSKVLWSNSVRIHYHGSSRESSLHYDPAGPPEAEPAQMVKQPRERASRSIVGLTFSSPSPSDFRSNPA